jgi:hypothetical protein
MSVAQVSELLKLALDELATWPLGDVAEVLRRRR